MACALGNAGQGSPAETEVHTRNRLYGKDEARGKRPDTYRGSTEHRRPQKRRRSEQALRGTEETSGQNPKENLGKAPSPETGNEISKTKRI